METRARTRGGGGGGGGGAAGAGESSASVVSGEHAPEDSDDDAPSELLAPLLDKWRDLLVKHVLERLDPTDCALIARVGKPWLAVVLANNLPRAGKGGAGALKLEDFVGSAEMLAWAKDNGCPWEEDTCAAIAAGGHLDVLQWAQKHDCPWDEATCTQLGAGTWRCWCGRGSTTARGVCILVHWPLGAGTWRCYSGRGSTAAIGTS